MEVILLERIEKLGLMGEVVKVKSGYARNYLLPQKKALRATEENKRRFEEQRVQLEATNVEHREEAEKLGKKFSGLQVVMVRQAGDTGQLYGSVNARDIAAAVTVAGVTITRQQVKLTHPIKTLGLHAVRVDLHPEVSVEVTANIARSGDEAKLQAKTGKAVISGEPEEAPPPAKEAPDKDAEKPEGDKAKAPEIVQEATKAAEEAADEAASEKAEEIFEEGATPTTEPEPDADTDADTDADSEAGAQSTNQGPAK